MENNVFETLNAINITDKVEQKNKFNYLSWAWAWGEVKKLYPDTTYVVYENANGWNYHTDGRTAWVKVGVTINGLEHIEMLPVMNYNNNSIPLEKITSYDVNKAIQRALTKAIARHGLGLYIYAGEDLPESDAQTPQANAKASSKKNTKAQQTTENSAPQVANGDGIYYPAPITEPSKKGYKCAVCGGLEYDVDLAKASKEKWGKIVCRKCIEAKKKEYEAQMAAQQATQQAAPVPEPVPPGGGS